MITTRGSLSSIVVEEEVVVVVVVVEVVVVVVVEDLDVLGDVEIEFDAVCIIFNPNFFK